MENFVALFIPFFLGVLLIRLLLLPVRWFLKIAIHSGSGLLCLWLLNTVSGYTGLHLPVNAVTALISGFFGVPGIGLIALLEIWGDTGIL